MKLLEIGLNHVPRHHIQRICHYKDQYIIHRWLEGLANSIASLKVLPASNQRWFGVVLLLLLLDFIIFYFGFGMRDDRFGWFVGVEVWAFFVLFV